MTANTEDTLPRKKKKVDSLGVASKEKRKGPPNKLDEPIKRTISIKIISLSICDIFTYDKLKATIV